MSEEMSKRNNKRSKVDEESPTQEPTPTERSDRVFVAIMFGVDDNMDTDGYVIGVFATGHDGVKACVRDMTRLVGRPPSSETGMMWDGDGENDDNDEWEYWFGGHGYRWLVKAGPSLGSFQVTGGPAPSSVKAPYDY